MNKIVILPSFHSVSKICNRCGRCCFYEKNGEWKKCKYLVLHGNKSSCRIWRHNYGTQIDEGVFCNEMKYVRFSFIGCPYNYGRPLKRVSCPPFND